ncbi:uncharacterized protein LOC102807463 [Saccoglossus kowalevskii]
MSTFIVSLLVATVFGQNEKQQALSDETKAFHFKMLETGRTTKQNCSHAPNTHWNATVDECVCDHGWYLDEGTAQCSRCVECCPGNEIKIPACVAQNLGDKICTEVKPCDLPEPTTDYESALPTRLKVGISIGVVITIISVVLISLFIYNKGGKCCNRISYYYTKQGGEQPDDE